MDRLARLLADVLGVESSMLFSDRSFAEQSIGASELRKFADALQKDLGVRPPDMIRQCTTLAQLHEWLAARGHTRTGSCELHLELGFSEGLPDALFYE